MKWTIARSIGFFCALPLGVAVYAQNSDAYLNPKLSVEARAADLVSRMTLDEKISQMVNHAPAIPRLHIQDYDWWNEGLHGVARSGYATIFPQAIGLAATWDTPLIGRVADVISTEARAKYNQAQREGNHETYYGLTFWSPNINIVRDPRWGRGQETYGEDPFLTGRIGSAFVRGLQGNDPKYLKLVATAKHFAVHNGPEPLRHTFNVNVSPHDLEDTYLPAFRMLVEDAHVASVMCAYNAIDGAPACGSPLLLQQTLRHDWKFSGYVVSDCGAIGDFVRGHKFAATMPLAASDAVKTGTDLDCGDEYKALTQAIAQKLISEKDIDRSLERLFAARLRLGMFDPPADVPFNRIPFSENNSPAHRELALETARASMVLLKNNRAALPLRSTTQTIAVIGPNAEALPALEGNYNAIASNAVTPLQALEDRTHGRVVYAQGSGYAEGLPVTAPRTLFSTTRDGKTGSGLEAEYFNGKTFDGKPALERIDHTIDFDWDGAPPAPGISPEAFSIRWTGNITAPAAGPIQFGFTISDCTTCNDDESIHVWIDGKPVYDFVHVVSHHRPMATPDFTVTFADTRPHALRIEYSHAAPHFGAGIALSWIPPANPLREQAVAAAERADTIVAFLGLSPRIEGEEMKSVHADGFNGGDRTKIELPDVQQSLVKALVSTGKPLILVLMNGSAIALGDANREASAILEAWYPGEEGGTAIADTIFGDNNPSGRLPETFYASTDQLPPFEDYSMANRTYRYFSDKPLYGFGYGLSYTNFRYAGASLSAKNIKSGDSLDARVIVKNDGTRDGAEVVECYLIPQSGAPLRSLVGFQKVALSHGESKTVSIHIDPRQLSLVDSKGNRSVQAGKYKLFLGGNQPDAGGMYLPFEITN